MKYLELLEHSFDVEKKFGGCPPESRLEYLSEYIFDFATYDAEMSETFAKKAVEVCSAINDSKTFDYIKDPENHKWYLLMCNMPFFASRLEWGTSIRGAWWGAHSGRQIEFQSCGLWMGDEQCSQTMKFGHHEWTLFITAVIAFAAGSET